MNKNLNINSAIENKVMLKVLVGGQFSSVCTLSFFNILLLIALFFPSSNAFAQDSIIVRGRFIDNTKYANVLMKNTWAYEMVANRPYYFTNPIEDPRIQDYERREHFWGGFNASNPHLLNTPLYTEHSLNYLRYWMNPYMNFSAEERTNGFKRAVDVIIRQFSEHQQIHEFAFKYLTLGFKQIGEEEVLQYLDENYKDLANRCFDNFEKTEFERRMEGYAAMKVGNLAPDFKIEMLSPRAAAEDSNGGSLYKVKSEKSIVVFWSSACPHCMEEMPKLNEWAATRKEVKVIAVSLDTDPKLHQETINGLPNMLHTSDYKGWRTEAAAKYYIAATPTFIVLDKEKKVVRKYSEYEQLKNLMTH
jgi:thiol-disulfide isomerase/thioredoxin